MFHFLTRLFSSFGKLADSLDALASTTAEANGRLRSQLSLDALAEPPRVLEHHADAEVDAKPSRNGKREKATT